MEVDRAAGAVRELGPGLPSVPGNDEAEIAAARGMPARVEDIRIGRMRREAHEVVLGLRNLSRDTIRPDDKEPMVGRQIERSEEHTSELQSLMRNSYAVFCLKKKKKYT